MKTHTMPTRPFMPLFAAVVLAAPQAGALDWSLLEAGSWRGGPAPSGVLANRAQISLALPQPGFSMRFQVLDTRRLPPEEAAAAHFSPGVGLYYHGGGLLDQSRLLWGALDERGIAARLSRVWARSVPFAGSRDAPTADLKIEPTSRAESAYASLRFPALGPFNTYATARLDTDDAGGAAPAWGGGVEARFGNARLRLDGLAASRTLAPRKASTWFAAAPPLPERETRLWGLGAEAEIDAGDFYIAAAADAAWSETFAFGRGGYGNAAVTLRRRPWRLCLAADAATERYVGRDGAASGAGERLAARLERSLVRRGLCRLDAALDAPAIGEAVDGGSLAALWRFSSPPARADPVFRVSRASLGVDWNGDASSSGRRVSVEGGVTAALRPPGMIRDAALGINLGEKLCRRAAYDSAVTSLDVTWEAGVLRFDAGVDWTARSNRDGVWGVSAAARLKTAWGWVRLKAASKRLPDQWEYEAAWRWAR